MFFHKKRNIHGFLLFDKPKGLSSNSALQKVKNIFHAKKAGYVGTLDPLATGLLPICFGECTKFSYYLIDSDKRYSVTAKLGEKTSTSDSDGVLIKKRPILFTRNELNKSIKSLTGLIDQIPSMYSAIKYYGIPLYKYARQGLNILRKGRKVTIYNIDVVRYKDNFISLNIFCSKGTYIRTLIEDLGEKLGCGAHVVCLRRLQVASYSCNESVKISDLNKLYNSNNFKKIDKLLMPIDSPVSFLPKVYLSCKQIKDFKLGKSIVTPLKIKNSLVRVLDTENKIFIGLGKINVTELLIPYRLVSILTN